MKNLIIIFTFLLFTVANSFSQDLNEQLFEAVKENNIQKIERLIERGADVNTKDKYEATPLHYACQYKNYFNIIKLLVEKGANVNAKDRINEWNYGNTPLHNACRKKNDFAVINFLISNNANVNMQNSNGYTALHFAVIQKEYKIIDLLLENKANPNLTISVKKEKYTTPLMIASYENDTIIMKKLIDNNADIKIKNNSGFNVWEIPDRNGCIPLFNAIKNENYELAKFFIKNGADINAKIPFLFPINFLWPDENTFYNWNNYNYTLLHYACKKQNNIKMINFLIENGSNINSLDDNNYTPLHYACEYQNDSTVVKILLANGANPNLQTIDETAKGWTALMIAAYHRKIDIFTTLINNGARTDIKNSMNKDVWEIQNTDGLTFLFYVIKNKNYQFARTLINYGADINGKIKLTQISPLHYACENNDFEMAKFLIENKADVNSVDNNNYTPLHYACFFKCDTKIINLLLENGANPNIQSTDKKLKGWTALMFAGYYQNIEAIELLLAYNANTKIINNQGKTAWEIKNVYGCMPWEIIFQKGQLKTVKILLSDSKQTKKQLKFKNNEGQSAIHYACQNEKGLEIVKFLINKKINVNTKDSANYTPLHYACLNKNGLEIVKLLIQNNAKVNSRDTSRCTPLHYACTNEKGLEIVKFLIKNNANINAINNDNYTPLHYAYKNKNGVEIVKFLVENSDMAKYIFIKSTFVEINYDRDILGLENSVNNQLIEISSKGSKSSLIFIEANEFPDAYQFRGQYTILGEQINLKTNIFQNQELIGTIEISGNKSNISKLSKELIDKSLKVINTN